MTSVRPFEAELLQVLDAILGRAPIDRALAALEKPRPRPKCFGRPALRLIEARLAGGFVRRLAGRDGWHRERFLREGRVVEGRLWERTPLEELASRFSGLSLEFLIRLVGDEPANWASGPEPAGMGPTPGDQFLPFFTYEVFRETRVGAALRKMPSIGANGLCRLAFPADFAERVCGPALDLASWVAPARAWVLEALQGTFADAWLVGEGSKREVVQVARVIAIGREQLRVIDSFLASIDLAGRRDLSRFLLRVSRELLRDGPGLEAWTGRLDTSGLRLSERAEAYRAALAPLSGLARLQRWEREARGVGFFEEGYAAAQIWKSDWEKYGGDDLCNAARSLYRSADPLATGS